jgi:hypothetical protein
MLVGARVQDIGWTQANNEVGPIKVTRLFYSGTLPTKFTRYGVPAGIRLIVSYKKGSANTAAYVKSIPAGNDVQLCYHHECEGPDDYAGDAATGGAQFVREFNAEHAAIKAANPAIALVMIAGSYQYSGGKTSSRGIGGHFMPDKADKFYLDSYQRGGADSSWNPIQPASQDKAIVNYLSELAKKGRQWNGFTEYGRGVGVNGAAVSSADIRRRIDVFDADRRWLAARSGINVWAYWYTTDLASGDQWRLRDAASQRAWANVAAA